MFHPSLRFPVSMTQKKSVPNRRCWNRSRDSCNNGSGRRCPCGSPKLGKPTYYETAIGLASKISNCYAISRFESAWKRGFLSGFSSIRQYRRGLAGLPSAGNGCRRTAIARGFQPVSRTCRIEKIDAYGASRQGGTHAHRALHHGRAFGKLTPRFPLTPFQPDPRQLRVPRDRLLRKRKAQPGLI